ncbi:YqzL family protein [Bacillus taeanensis]|uniref:YqzL family protein n=1 Tax=Bacillus taeanensis TaxID=273032 RepID=A0A366Y276_9BACI|nr:YqzL family protein [Bacillus taeanensis]RBW70513.1 YqzL family protein [Bacillus taeanensis]
MLNFAWKVFCVTGNVETYLLVKEMENYSSDEGKEVVEEVMGEGEVNVPFT